MSNNSEQIKQNTIARIGELTKQLAEIDETDGAKARELLNLYSALHVDPSENTKDEQGRTAAEVYAEYEKVSQEVAAKKKPLEDQLADFQKGLGRIADDATLRQASKERAAASAAACQEPFRDYTEFSNPELDRIRSGLQKNPLPGGDKSSIDDGSGGGEVTTSATAAAGANTTPSSSSA